MFPFPFTERIPLNLEEASGQVEVALQGERLILPTLEPGWVCWRYPIGHRPGQVFCERGATDRLEVWHIPHGHAEREHPCWWEMSAYQPRPVPWARGRQTALDPVVCEARWRQQGRIIELKWFHVGVDLVVVRAELPFDRTGVAAETARRWLEGVRVSGSP